MADQNMLEGIGIAIEQTRLEKGLSREEVRTAANISVEYLGKIERGNRIPQPAKLVAIAEALGTTVPDLFAKARSLRLSRELAARGTTDALIASAAVTALMAAVPVVGLPLAALRAWRELKQQQPTRQITGRNRNELVDRVEKQISKLSDEELSVLAQFLEAPK